MKNRIRNILIETLILESPLFRSVAVKVDNDVFKGEPYQMHSDVLEDIISNDAFPDVEHDYNKLFAHHRVITGFITIDGEFVSREEALQITHSVPESISMRNQGILPAIQASYA